MRAVPSTQPGSSKEVLPENWRLWATPELPAHHRQPIKLLLAYGCTKDELRTVFQVPGARLLGLEDPQPFGAPVHPGQEQLPPEHRYVGYPQADRMHAGTRMASIRSLPRPTVVPTPTRRAYARKLAYRQASLGRRLPARSGPIQLLPSDNSLIGADGSASVGVGVAVDGDDRIVEADRDLPWLVTIT